MWRGATSLLVSHFYSQSAGNAMSSTDRKHIRLTSRWSSSDRSPELPPLVSMVTCWCEAASGDLSPSGEVCDTLTSICSSVSRPRQGPCVQRRCDRFVFPLCWSSHDHDPSTPPTSSSRLLPDPLLHLVMLTSRHQVHVLHHIVPRSVRRASVARARFNSGRGGDGNTRRQRSNLLTLTVSHICICIHTPATFTSMAFAL